MARFYAHAEDRVRGKKVGMDNVPILLARMPWLKYDDRRYYVVGLDEIKLTVGEVLQLGSRVDDFDRDTILLGNIPEFDSLAVVNLMTALEEKLDIYFDDDEVNGDVFASLGSLHDFVSMKKSG